MGVKTVPQTWVYATKDNVRKYSKAMTEAAIREMLDTAIRLRGGEKMFKTAIRGKTGTGKSKDRITIRNNPDTKAFPGNQEYTHRALVRQSGAVALHFRDGSWRGCSCNSDKHFPTIAELASEGIGFATSEAEKAFMRGLQAKAEYYWKLMDSRKLTDAEAERIHDWARAFRQAIRTKKWSGSIDSNCDSGTCSLGR